MPEYVYVATDADGVRIEATIEATSPQSALSKLRMQDLDPISIEEVGVDVSSQADTPAAEGPERPTQPAPPPPPRELPPEIGRWYRWKSPLVFFGIAFGGISTAIFLVLAVTGAALAALVPAWFVAIGFAIAAVAWRRNDRRVRAWRYGVAAEATITSVGQASYQVNGRSPFKMEYEFLVDGTQTSGVRTTFNDAITEYDLHDRIWVVYDPNEPSASAEWPPIP